MRLEEKYREVLLTGVERGVYMVGDKGSVFKGGVRLSPRRRGRTVRIWVEGMPQDVNVDRLVARAFVDNPDLCNYIRHKDGDLYNNNAENLEWCFEQDDLVKRRERKKGGIIIGQYNKDGKLVHRWNSVSDICKSFKVRPYQVTRAMKGERETMRGFIWRRCRAAKKKV